MSVAPASESPSVRLGLTRPRLLLATAVQVINQHRLFDAMDLVRRVLAVEPENALAWSCLGSTLERLGDLGGSLEAFERAVEVSPSDPRILSNHIFALDRAVSTTMEQARAARRRYNDLVSVPPRPHTNDRDPDRVLRVGYVSGDVREHSAPFGWGPVVLNHDSSVVETFLYSVTPEHDWITDVFRGGVQNFRSCAADTDDELDAKIRADQIDILVDLSGHSAGNRLPVFARKPAPVQVTAWGYITGTGLDAVDYLFADDVMIHPEEEQFYAERVVRLPRIMPYWPPDPAAVGEIGPLPAAANGYLTFGVFNRLGKLTPDCLLLWARIMAAAPTARLIVKAGGLEIDQIREHFSARCEAAGLDMARVEIAGATSRDDHMRAYGRVDLALDPWPDGGGISTLDAAWMGVPTLTAPWHQIPSRTTATINRELGLDCLTVRTPTEYVERAVSACDQIEELADIRRWMRDLMTASAFGSHALYTRHVERAYRQMWSTWAQEQAEPASEPPMLHLVS